MIIRELSNLELTVLINYLMTKEYNSAQIFSY